MRINRATGNLFWDSSNVPENGIVHCFADWSLAGRFIEQLTKDLEDYPSLDFWILPLDSNSMKFFSEKYSVRSDGKGETYWLHRGKIVAFIYDLRSQVYDVSMGGAKQLLKRHCELLLSLSEGNETG